MKIPPQSHLINMIYACPIPPLALILIERKQITNQHSSKLQLNFSPPTAEHVRKLTIGHNFNKLIHLFQRFSSQKKTNKMGKKEQVKKEVAKKVVKEKAKAEVKKELKK